MEADETYFGRPEVERKTKHKRTTPYLKKPRRNSRPIVALVERGGRVRSFHVANADKHSVGMIVFENIAHESRLHTDESSLYPTVGEEFAKHETVKHSAKEYVRGDVHTNSVEGFFGNLQARHDGRVSPLQRAAPSTLPGRILVPLLEPQQARG